MMIIVETEVGGDPTIPLVVERIDTDLYNVHVSNLFCHKDCGPTDTFRAMGYYIGHNGTDRAITIHREGGHLRCPGRRDRSAPGLHARRCDACPG